MRDAAARALTENQSSDARPAEALARCAADAAANLRSLDKLQRSVTVGGARQLALALDRPQRSTSEALRGHLYAALAHTLARARHRDPQTSMEASDAVGERAWGSVCADAATAATPWVRLAARAALCEGARGGRWTGPRGESGVSCGRADARRVSGLGRRGAVGGCGRSGGVLRGVIEIVSHARDAAARVADAGSVDALAAAGAFAPPDIDGGGLRSGAAGAGVSPSFAAAAAGASKARSSAQKHCCARAADVGRRSLAQALLAVEAPPRDLGHLRAARRSLG